MGEMTSKYDNMTIEQLAATLSPAMINALHTGRNNDGTAAVLGHTNTIVALIDRGLVTAGRKNQWTDRAFGVAALVLRGKVPTIRETNREQVAAWMTRHGLTVANAAMIRRARIRDHEEAIMENERRAAGRLCDCDGSHAPNPGGHSVACRERETLPLGQPSIDEQHAEALAEDAVRAEVLELGYRPVPWHYELGMTDLPPDTTPNGVDPACLHRYRDYWCTRKVRHAGTCRAGDGTRILAEWYAEPAPVEPSRPAVEGDDDVVKEQIRAWMARHDLLTGALSAQRVLSAREADEREAYRVGHDASRCRLACCRVPWLLDRTRVTTTARVLGL